jgi:hypothetical protein
LSCPLYSTLPVSCNCFLSICSFFLDDSFLSGIVYISCQTGFKNPEGPIGYFQSAFKTDMQMFAWLMQTQEQMGYFNNLIIGQRMTRIEWFDVAPDENVLFDEKMDVGSPLIVDIGGNRGNDLEASQTKFPKEKGKAVPKIFPRPLVISKN